MKAKNPPTSEIEAKEKLIVYVYEYLAYAGAKRAAQTFLEDINYDNDIEIKPLEGPGFLADWWCVFWDLYCAADSQSPERATSEARAFQDLTRRGASGGQPPVIQHRPMPTIQCAQHQHQHQLHNNQQQQIPQHATTNGQHFYLAHQSPMQMRADSNGTYHRIANVSHAAIHQQTNGAGVGAVGTTFMSVDGSTRYISAPNAQHLAQMNVTRQQGGHVLIRPTVHSHLVHSNSISLAQHQQQQQLLQNVPCQMHRPAFIQMQAQQHNRFGPTPEWQNPDNSIAGDQQCFTPGSGTNVSQVGELAMGLNGSGQQDDSTASNDGRLSKEGSEEYPSMPSNYGQDLTDGGSAPPDEAQKLKDANLNNGSKEFNNDINNPSSGPDFNIEYVSQVTDGPSIVNRW